jgi:hypothetical protein
MLMRTLAFGESMTTTKSATLYLNSMAGGPVLRVHRLRALAVWALVALIGIAPSLTGAPNGWQAAGLSLWFPGAGFLYSGPWWATILTIAAFGVSVVLWLLMGGFIFAAAVWLVSAALAALLADSHRWAPAGIVVPATTLTFVALAGSWLFLRRRAIIRAAPAVNQHLGTVPFRDPLLKSPVPGELDDTSLRELRYLLDKALQPLDRFEGFNTIDQFREAAWRYQLVTINHALAALQVNHLPAFSGYLQAAQRNAIRKMTDRRVWHYWRIENFVGNLKFGADPIKSENIMYSGWWALALGAFERATGDTQFSEPGALTLVDKPGRQFVYDYPSIVQAIVRQFDDRRLCFFPCEPNWVFTVCNLYGMGGALLYDRQHGTRHGLDRLEKFNGILETEFTRCDGGSVVIASRRAGLALTASDPFAAQSNTWLTNIVSPRQAQVAWALVRRFHLEHTSGNLYDITPRGAGMVDPGNYRMTGAWFWASTMASAREVGDGELYGIAAEKFEALAPSSADGHPPEYHQSLFCRAMACVGRFGAQDTWHRFAHGDVAAPPTDGPHLSDVPYLKAQIAAAAREGDRLRVVLYPVENRPVTAPMVFGGLQPGRPYRVSGATDPTVVADHTGSATTSVELTKRTEILVSPAL